MPWNNVAKADRAASESPTVAVVGRRSKSVEAPKFP